MYIRSLSTIQPRGRRSLFTGKASYACCVLSYLLPCKLIVATLSRISVSKREALPLGAYSGSDAEYEHRLSVCYPSGLCVKLFFPSVRAVGNPELEERVCLRNDRQLRQAELTKDGGNAA